MKKLNKFMLGLSALALAAGGAFASSSLTSMIQTTAEADDEYFFCIPGTLPVPDTKDEEHYDWGGNMNIEGTDGDKNFSNAYEGSTLTFKNVHVHEAGGYAAIIPLDWATGNGAKLKIEVIDSESNLTEAFCNTDAGTCSGWSTKEFPLMGIISEGIKNIKFSFTPGEGRNWAFNFKAPEFVRTGEGSPIPDSELYADWMKVPGDIEITDKSWVFDGKIRLEEKDGNYNIGCVQNNNSATGNIYVKEGGIYKMTIDFYAFYNACDFHVEITDLKTGKKEVDTHYEITEQLVADINLDGYLTPGPKTIKYTFTNEKGGYLVNYRSHKLEKIGGKFAVLTDVSVDGIDSAELDGYDYSFNLPYEYDQEFVTLNANFQDATLKAKIGDEDLSVSQDGAINVPTPAVGQSCDVILSLEVEDGVSASKPEYKVHIYHIDPNAVPVGWLTIPGTLDITHNCWSYEGGLYVENGGANVGYINNGCVATGEAFVKEAGVYNMHVDFPWHQNVGDIQIEIIDQASNKKEIDTYYTIFGKHVADILLEGVVTPGKKTIKYSFHNDGGYIANYKSPEFTKIAENFAVLNNISVEGIDPVDLEGYDYTFNLPIDYAQSSVKVKVDYSGAPLKATVGETELPVNDGIIEVPTPVAAADCELSIKLNTDENTAAPQTDFKVRIYHIGDVVLSALSLDGLAVGEDVIADFNENNTGINIEGLTFTSLPEVIATFVDGSSVTAKGEMKDANTASYTFTGKAGNLTQDFSFTLPGIHIYQPSDNDIFEELRYDAGYKGKAEDGNWSNGLFYVSCNDGWSGTQFKMKNNPPVTLSAPSYMKIKQIKMVCLYDNYTEGRVASVTSEGATIYLPSASAFKTGVDNDHALNLVINVEDHTPGTPFVFTFEGGSQPVCWFEFTYEEIKPTTAPEVVKTSATSVVDRNHAVVAFQFNRVVKDATITVNGKNITADGGNTTLYFPLWDLPYESNVEVTIPAGAVSDTYGNKTAKAYTHVLEVGSPAVAAPIAADRFVAVSNVNELRDAVAALSSSNNTRDALQTVIFVKNGDYDLEANPLEISKVYNVSLIGESQNGVLIHGNRKGISNPVFSTRNAANIYMENLTVRNDLDFGKPERGGVGVAHYGGELDILKNVTLQSIQDTEVTGERGYWNNVTIHGNADYICGGGNHYFDNCTIMNELGGGYITAPATSAAQKYGYVFQNCTIDGEGNYSLGRPWQNEPRAFFLNTTMKALPSDGGWGGMSDLTTHFFEHNSMDANGNALDLSKRTNSPSSVNSYSPILPAEYADHFTPRNVLGGIDSWDAEACVEECAAPAPATDEKGDIVWNKVDGASGYLVFYNGNFVAYTPELSYAPADNQDPKLFTLAAINPNGCRGKMSVAPQTTAVDSFNVEEAAVEYFNLQGVRISGDVKGAVIKVTRTADGKIKSEKIFNK